jgi:hypothetical protein
VERLRELLDAVSAGRRVAWIDYRAYAERLSGRPLDPADGAQDFIMGTKDAQQLLQSDVLTLPLVDLYRSLFVAAAEPDVDGGRAVTRLRELLAAEEPRSAAVSVLDGLQSLYPLGPPLVVVSPSPAHWLRLLGAADVDEDLDAAAAMYLADALRALARTAVSGIVLDDGSESLLSDPVSIFQPVWNVAQHYGWAMGIMSANGEVADLLRQPVDFVLRPDSTLADIAPFWRDGLLVGGGLDAGFWSGTEPLPADLPAAAFGYGVIPEGAVPELVLGRIREWGR